MEDEVLADERILVFSSPSKFEVELFPVKEKVELPDDMSSDDSSPDSDSSDSSSEVPKTPLTESRRSEIELLDDLVGVALALLEVVVVASFIKLDGF